MLLRKSTTDIGRKGEKIAAKFLKKNGYKILDKNFHSAHGEIDIIACDKESLVFVEVKARKDCKENFENYGRPSEAVTKTKQKHIIFTSRIYLEKHPTEKEIRFDVIEVYLGKPTKVYHIENAFYS